MKKRMNEDGLTLVEVLVTLLVAIMFMGIITAVFINGVRSFQRTSLETQMRDDADYIMGECVKHFYSEKSSHLSTPDSKHLINNATKEELGINGDSIYLKTKDGNTTILNQNDFSYSDSTITLKDNMLIIHLEAKRLKEPYLTLHLKNEMNLLE